MPAQNLPELCEGHIVVALRQVMIGQKEASTDDLGFVRILLHTKLLGIDVGTGDKDQSVLSSPTPGRPRVRRRPVPRLVRTSGTNRARARNSWSASLGRVLMASSVFWRAVT